MGLRVIFIEVQEDLGACNGSRSAIISGTMKSTKGDPVEGVNVTMSGTPQHSMATLSNGAYAFGNLVTGNDYTITPSKLDDIRNGVSTVRPYLNCQACVECEIVDDRIQVDCSRC
ncbi:MAG: carboxypeptidase-like regulatory domain-containing protein [Saprospiraceae bacterium]